MEVICRDIRHLEGLDGPAHMLRVNGQPRPPLSTPPKAAYAACALSSSPLGAKQPLRAALQLTCRDLTHNADRAAPPA